jgi:hypothetical protein
MAASDLPICAHSAYESQRVREVVAVVDEAEKRAAKLAASSTLVRDYPCAEARDGYLKCAEGGAGAEGGPLRCADWVDQLRTCVLAEKRRAAAEIV